MGYGHGLVEVIFQEVGLVKSCTDELRDGSESRKVSERSLGYMLKNIDTVVQALDQLNVFLETEV